MAESKLVQFRAQTPPEIDFLIRAIAPAVVKEKHRPGWHKTWNTFHQRQLNLFDGEH